ncbi:MAG TPA: dienelactone hydrolase family protein [Acidimicrobiales bacterium]|nr:dienelactone hydrolase family protein [Acidimicrobiales bacterium]
MGENVEFACPNGSTAGGYLAPAASGKGPGVLVIQEWWGLVPQIKGVADRLAAEGFTALAPDLYHGEAAGHTEMDKAGQLMSTLPPDRAANDMAGAVHYLLGHDAATGKAVGVVGFCMGGMLTWVIAALQGDKVAAGVSYYGAPLDPSSAPDWNGLTAPILAHVAENDSFFAPPAIEGLADTLRGMGKDVTVEVYPGTGHAFANEEDAMHTYDAKAADLAWGRTLDFLRSHLGA